MKHACPASSASGTPRRILCVHQSAELYGSDRAFGQSVRALRAQFPSARIDVRLPRSGPLVEVLAPWVDDVVFEDLLLLSRIGLQAAIRRPARTAGRGRGWIRRIRTAAEVLRRYDLAYVNTVVVLGYALAARTAATPTLIHVHELPLGRAERLLFSGLLGWSGAAPIFNSAATAGAFRLPAKRQRFIVPNGSPRPAEAPPLPNGDSAPLRVLLLGRRVPRKGHAVLIEAAAQAERSIDVRLVGDPLPGTDAYTPALQALIDRVGARVQIEPFQRDTDALYAWADLVAVPSTLPESFGLVATEAMARRRPVVAAGHGGITEIVAHGQTGSLVPPGDVRALADVLRAYADDRPRLAREATAAQRRYEALFGEAAYLQNVGRAARAVLDATRRELLSG